jgi:hypothetical protein
MISSEITFDDLPAMDIRQILQYFGEINEEIATDDFHNIIISNF